MALSRLAPSPATFRKIAFACVAALAIIVLTGGAVRLTDSGLGCTGWPNCGPGRLTPPLSFHPLVEFGNRVFTVVVAVVVGAAAAGSMLMRPRRRDLVALSWGLVAGYLFQAVLGGLSVIFKLSPLWVMAHFLASMLLLWDAMVLLHRANPSWRPGLPRVVRREVVLLGRVLAVTAGWVLFMGTVTTGTGPHSGAPDAAARLPFPFWRVAQLHADSALFLTGLVVATLFALRIADAPPTVWRRARWLIGAIVVQVAIGYWQYFTGLPPGVVELHMAGATTIWMTTIGLNLSFAAPQPDVAPAPGSPSVSERAEVSIG